MNLIEASTSFDENADGLLIKQAQELPDNFLSDLRAQKLDSTSQREREFMHVAAIPEIVHLQWLKEGYDCTREPIRETVKRLRNLQLDDFIVTNKRV